MRPLPPALVILAHGSGAPRWTIEIEQLAAQVRSAPGLADAFSHIGVAYLDHAHPTVGEAVQLALQAGCREVLAVPLLLTASTHLEEDVPGLLGLPVAEHVRRRLRAEGRQPLPPGLPVRLVPLATGPGLVELVAGNVLRRAKTLTRQRVTEAVVLAAHGSAVHHERWEAFMVGIEQLVLAASFAAADHAYVGHAVGMSSRPTVDAVARVAARMDVQRVLVLPVLVSPRSRHLDTVEMGVELARREISQEIVFARDAILPDPGIAQRVASAGLSALGLYPTSGDEASA